MPSDLQVTNIKASDGTAGLVIADSSGEVTGTLGNNTKLPLNAVCYARSYYGTSGTDYDLETTYSNGVVTNNQKYYTNNYFKYTPKYDNSELLITGGFACKFGNSSGGDVGFSFFIGVTPTGGSETFPVSLTEFTSGNSHSVVYFETLANADTQYYHSYYGSYVVSNTNEYLFKLWMAPWSCNRIDFNSYSSRSMAHINEVRK